MKTCCKLVIVSLFINLLSGCKDPFDEQAKATVELSIQLASFETLDGNLKVESGFLNTSEIVLTSTAPSRDQESRSIDMSAHPALNLHVPAQTSPLFFELSKGLVSSLDLRLVFVNDQIDFKNYTLNGDSIALASYLDNARPAFLFFGSVRSKGQDKNFILALDSINELSFVISSAGDWGDRPVRQPVTIDEYNIVSLFYYTNLIFSSVTQDMIDGSTSQLYKGVETIFIHRSHNPELYRIIRKNIVETDRIMIRNVRQADPS